MMTAVETAPVYVDVLEDRQVEILSPKVVELRAKIHDENYINNAISRIAQVLSKKLMDNPEEYKLNSSSDDAW